MVHDLDIAELHTREEHLDGGVEALLELVVEPRDLFAAREQRGGALLDASLELFVEQLEPIVLSAHEVLIEAVVRLDDELLDGHLDDARELFVLPGLEHEAKDIPAVDRLDCGGQVVIPRQHDTHDVGVVLADVLEQLGAAHPRHELIRDDHGDVFVALERLDRLEPIGGGQDVGIT